MPPPGIFPAAHSANRFALASNLAVSLRGVAVAQGQTPPALPIHLENPDADHVPFLQLVPDALDPLFGDLRDMHQTVAAGKNGDEGAEVHQTRDFAFIDPAHF